MADAKTLQKRPRGRPRKVVADAEAPAIDLIVDTIPTKDVKPAPADAKKPRAKREATTKADTAIEKKTRTKSTTTQKTNGSPQANQKPATTKQLADPPAAAAAASITPPNPTPQASPSTTTARPPQRKAAAEPAPDNSAEPTTAIATEVKNSTTARADTTTAVDSKILSELAARELLLPLQSGKDDNGAEGNEEKTTVGSEDAGRVLEASHLGLLRDTQADEANTKVAGELHRQEKELARINSTSVANSIAPTPSGSSGSGSSSDSIETKNSTPAHLQPPPSSTTASTTPPRAEAAHTITPPMSRPQQQQQQPPQGQSQQSPPANKPPRPLPYSPHPHRPQARISSTNEPSKAQQAPPAAAAPPAKEQRPPPHQWKPVEPLPAAYKPAARRWTLAIVAMPVALVTSYALYDRLVLGNKRKEFPRVVNPDLSSAVKEVEAEKTEKGL